MASKNITNMCCVVTSLSKVIPVSAEGRPLEHSVRCYKPEKNSILIEHFQKKGFSLSQKAYTMAKIAVKSLFFPGIFVFCDIGSDLYHHSWQTNNSHLMWINTWWITDLENNQWCHCNCYIMTTCLMLCTLAYHFTNSYSWLVFLLLEISEQNPVYATH